MEPTKTLRDFEQVLCKYAIGTAQGSIWDPKFAAWIETYLTDGKLHGVPFHFKSVYQAESAECRSKSMAPFPEVTDKLLTDLAREFECLPDDIVCTWIPYEPYHAAHLATIPVIERFLKSPHANEWATECNGYITRLRADALPLADGLNEIRNWLRELRRMIRIFDTPLVDEPTNKSQLSLSPIPETNTQPPVANIFQRKGQGWVIRFDAGETFPLKDSKGAAHIHQLLQRPSVPISHFELQHLCNMLKGPTIQRNAGDEEPGSFPTRDSGPTMDAETIAQCRKKMNDLRVELESAERNSDLGLKEKLQSEIHDLEQFTLGVIKPNGELAGVGDEFRKQCDRVSKAIRRALAQIEKADLDAWRHLSDSIIRMGNHWVYDPSPKLDWEL